MELVCESTQAASWSRQGILLENTPGFTVTRAIVEPRTLTTLIKDVASISDRGPYKCEDGADSFIRDVAIFTSKYCINNTKFDFSLFFKKIFHLIIILASKGACFSKLLAHSWKLIRS